MKITETRDKITIENAVSSDRVRALYQLGDLDDYYFDKCRWYFIHEGDSFEALILLYESAGTTFIPLGSPKAVEFFLNHMSELLPQKFYSAWWTEFDGLMSDRFNIPNAKAMYRMALDRADFRPAEVDIRSRQLGTDDIDDVKRLLESYPGNFFEEYQLQTGFYRGVFDDDNLVAMAGIHTVNRSKGVAAIGNVVTDRDYRGRGLGTVVTSHVAEKLFREVDLLGLNVARGNTAAVRAYRRLGFDVRLEFYEGFCFIDRFEDR